uniref:Uncharacterized protein n=1 Tax=Anguilla anguilla TaxID=7936 RepID=A0A0E9W0Q3_ANGAN
MCKYTIYLFPCNFVVG